MTQAEIKLTLMGEVATVWNLAREAIKANKECRTKDAFENALAQRLEPWITESFKYREISEKALKALDQSRETLRKLQATTEGK